MDENECPYSFHDISAHGKREIEMLKRLQHPSILSIYDVYRGRRRGSVYIITELFDTNLSELMEYRLLDTVPILMVIYNR